MTDRMSYALILRIINDSPDPADALRAFVNQEREYAAHNARPATREEVVAHTAAPLGVS